MNKKKFFGECAYYSPNSDIEKQKAKEYLEYWKNNLINKLKRETFEIVLVDEQWIERPGLYISALCQHDCLALKICLQADFNYELKM